MISSFKPEVLAPAGSFESLIAAIRCGADAVYIGGKSFSARQNATNFDDNELKDACELAHKSGVKIYQTINTLVFDEQLPEVIKAVEYASQIGIDALILQDIGIADIVKNISPDMPLHASTQMSIHTKQGALLAKESGFSRVVVARESDRNQLSEIAGSGIEIEAFVHGALCMSVSGQCYMSAMIGSRSANRGLCAQACRLPFSAIKGESRCDLSLRDLSLISYINDMAAIGISSFKIEGRMKRPEYVAAAVSACRAVIDKNEPDLDILRSVFSRSGFTDGYFVGSLGSHMFGTRQKEDVLQANEALPKLQNLYRKERKATDVDFVIKLENNTPCILSACDSDGNCVEVFGDIPQQAINRPADKQQIENQLSKLGDTIYNFKSLDAKIGEGLMMPASSLNSLRRLACDELDKKRIYANTIIKNTYGYDLSFKKSDLINQKSIRIDLSFAKQIPYQCIDSIEYITLPLSEIEKLDNSFDKDKIIISLPRFTKNEEKLIEQLSIAKQQGFKNVECQNFAHIRLGRSLDINIFGGFGLNITNSYSIKSLSDYGLVDCIASFELKLSQISRLSDFIPYGVIAYGELPVMLCVNCPIKQASGCNGCEKVLTDRTSRTFDIKCNHDYIEILNSDTLYMADRLDEIRGASFITLKFNNETSSQVFAIINKYKTMEPAPKSNFTRGLYYRGII